MVVPASCYHCVAAGMTALQIFYNSSTGLWNTSKWWQAGNALETTIDYSRITNTKTYHNLINNTFEKNKGSKFINEWFYDDDGWWALTWIKAYDLTGETRYLDMAKTIFNDMKQGWDSTCGGGIWWKKKRIYKNAITNELFLSVAARLHLRTKGDSGPGSYLDWAQRTWNWFKSSGMINSKNLVNDGLNDACQNNGKTVWTYNQGVILGGLVDLYKATNDRSLIVQAQAIADAAIKKLAPKGILQEPCEPSSCGDDGPQFKGVFIRNLYYLYEITNKPAYKNFITQNANSIWLHRNRNNQFGLNWAAPVDQVDAARQSSAMDALNAAMALNKKIKEPTFQVSSNFAPSADVAGWTGKKLSLVFHFNAAGSGKYDLVFLNAAVDHKSPTAVF